MKKAIAIIIMGLLISGNAEAATKSIWDYLHIGMTKKEFEKVVHNKSNKKYYKTKEMIEVPEHTINPTSGKSILNRILNLSDNSNKTYYPEFRTEILKHYSHFRGVTPVYVFENVNKPSICPGLNKASWARDRKKEDRECEHGDGTLKAVVWSVEEALLIAELTYAQKNKDKKKAKKKAAEAETTVYKCDRNARIFIRITLDHDARKITWEKYKTPDSREIENWPLRKKVSNYEKHDTYLLFEADDKTSSGFGQGIYRYFDLSYPGIKYFSGRVVDKSKAINLMKRDKYAKRVKCYDNEQFEIAKAEEKKKAEEERIAEEKKRAEEKRIAEEKAKAEEYKRLEAKYRKKCEKAFFNPKGFEEGTPEYKSCILDLGKQDIAKAEEKKKAEEERIALENKLSKIDPDLIPIATGSGFFVSRDGYIITNEHVAGICELLAIKVEGRKKYFNVVTTDQVNDLGLLKGNYKHPKYLEIDIEGPNLGEEIVTMGYPLGAFTGTGVKITKGIVSSLSGPGNNYSEFQIDAAIGPGSSGGPIMNKSAQVVGVAYGGINKMRALKEQEHIPENVNFAISSQTLTNFLKANKVMYTKANRDKKLDTEAIAQIGDAATVHLFCLNTREAYAKIKRANKHTDVLLDLQ